MLSLKGARREVCSNTNPVVVPQIFVLIPHIVIFPQLLPDLLLTQSVF